MIEVLMILVFVMLICIVISLHDLRDDVQAIDTRLKYGPDVKVLSDEV